EVLGLDVVPQSPNALAAAIARLGLPATSRFSILELGIEQADSLGRRFDLVLSNNVFEHLPHLDRAFEVCARLVEPYRGRLAIFTDPLYYSSAGSHLPVEPWEHLWGEPEAVRQRLLGSGLGAGHPLRSMDLGTYLTDEISLNRMRLGDFLEGIRKAGLAVLNLRLVRDRHLADLCHYRDRLPGLAEADLTIEGIAAELVLLAGPAPPDLPPFVATEEVVLAAQGQAHYLERSQLQETLEAERRRSLALVADLARERRRALDLQQRLDEVGRVLTGVEASASFRLGRLATAPLRWLRGLVSR
ncbi:MAG TPA: class I SAM-dependent methyltransferase, partial [Thermoanaerobaculia bacterium]|nr:class I SAM-dependent methyltransferase [Thermoanaerobaculia bacterium]